MFICMRFVRREYHGICLELPSSQFGIVTKLQADVRGTVFRLPAEARYLCLLQHRPDRLWRPPIQWMPRDVNREVNGRSVNPTTHLHLVPRLKMSGVVSPLPHMPSWRGKGKLLLFLAIPRKPTRCHD